MTTKGLIYANEITKIMASAFKLQHECLKDDYLRPGEKDLIDRYLQLMQLYGGYVVDRLKL